MKKLTRVICVVAFCLVAMMGMSNQSLAAIVGEVSDAPEMGWKRSDDSNTNIVYTGTWTRHNSNSSDTDTLTNTISSYQFKFYGTKFRLISDINDNHSNAIIVTIDGVAYTYSGYYTRLIHNTIVFEKLGLNLGYHTVEVKNTVDGKYIHLDAIDIDDTGKLVSLTDSEFEGNSAILEIVMTNGTSKEYNLTNTELEVFLAWYDNRSDGIGKSYYRIPKKSNVKPFLSRREYLSFDKIYSFEVKDYNE
ncbi:MAG: hypothetical protein ACERKN_09645 [Velocimicrobium sp.]